MFDPNATAFFEQWTRLERDMLLDVWSTRRKADPFLIGQYLFASLGWLASIPAVSCYAVVLGSAHRSAADTMPLAFKAAAILSLVESQSSLALLSGGPPYTPLHPGARYFTPPGAGTSRRPSWPSWP